MEQTLAYLREILSNYLDCHDETPKRIYKKLISKPYRGEGEFVRDLTQEESTFLDRILPHEIRYAMDERDYERVYQLNEVYELLI
ncbi:sigma-G-dependent sporulation-specific acid-soluble spore protein CsgA [Geobacillus stearothermophilus]|uniref:sigma-G-dependent sporulation-specific acid-soluble spore protein CsgA n=1 Tax=Geobacillus stearothermophilus TaxID=1422 RepID=UPI002E24E01E|nr:sigma-G-dependent sporulation-specific acid-soluble spore protein CsgA [Geobacillus stearothermophilus]MED4356919.1 sigma-G-dependent sporulation-specific acid-soluble spore protein CsgA [Geobacillus stearothermophilus]